MTLRLDDKRADWLARHVLPHEPAMRAWLRSRRLIGLDVDDIVQETYARLIMAEDLASVRDPRAYAFQTARSVLLTSIRRSKVVSFQTMADLDVLGAAAPEPSPEQSVIDRDELQRLAEAIAAMPPRVRQVFSLRRVDGFSQREVALRLKLAESTVEKHMARALRFLLARFAVGGSTATRASSRDDGKSGLGDV